MKINENYIDNNLDTFSLYFDFKAILGLIDQGRSLRRWLGDMSKTSYLEEEKCQFIDQLSQAMDALESKVYSGNWELTQAEKLVVTMKKGVKIRKNSAFCVACFLVAGLCYLAEYTPSPEDMQALSDWMQQFQCVMDRRLYIGMEQEQPVLYYGWERMEKLPLGKDPCVSIVRHPFSGYLGIDRAGRLINGSAFVIPVLRKKAVKVLLNRMHYVILLEDGSLVHNLTFGDLPTQPVKNVFLSRDGIDWEPME